jgi:predicted  nucleic acid-binding Zn-ribbon protein
MAVFGKDKKGTLHTIINELVERTNGEAQRLRVLEQRIENIDQRINSIEENILSSTNQMQSIQKDNDEKLKKRDERLAKIDTVMGELVKHFKKLATKAEVKEVQNMVDIYNPVKSNFITKEELERTLSERNK